jgi:2-isopropylmalate synthase
MGFELDKQQLDTLYQRFTALADRKKGLLDEEIIALVQEVQQMKAQQVAAD